jgi:hypothetical protein
MKIKVKQKVKVVMGEPDLELVDPGVGNIGR